MSVVGAGEPQFFHLPFLKSLLLVVLPPTKSDQRESIFSGARDSHQIPLGYGVRHAGRFAQCQEVECRRHD